MVARKKRASAAARAGKTVKKKADKTESQDSAAGKKSIESVTVILEPVITLSEVAGLKEKLLGHITAGELKIDATRVEHIDTGGLQLLLSLSRAFKGQGRQIDWLGWSGACKHTAELLGLKKALEIKDN